MNKIMISSPEQTRFSGASDLVHVGKANRPRAMLGVSSIMMPHDALRFFVSTRHSQKQLYRSKIIHLFAFFKKKKQIINKRKTSI